MSFWPWRSRPVITPFSDNYSGRNFVLGRDIHLVDFDLYIPDNIYIIPTNIIVHITTGIGLRAVDPSYIHFYRGGELFSATPFPPVQSSSFYYFIIGNAGCDYDVTGSREARLSPLCSPLFLYPSDRLHITIDSLLATDVVNFVSIFGQTWEVH